MSFPWFWSFWHWTAESFRAGALLRGPLHGIGGHWEVWLAHEASEEERRAITDVGRSARRQREFVVWLARRWAPEVACHGERPSALFVLGQLARVAPFHEWPALARYRRGVGVRGVSAVVLAEDSAGEAPDVRRMVAIALPAGPDGEAPAIVAEGFHVDGASLDRAWHAARSLLRGRGLLLLLALWAAGGRRPYPRGLAVLLGLGWLGVGASIVYLLTGPDPGERLTPLSAGLTIAWGLLALTGVAVAGAVCVQAWRAGRQWSARLERSQVRLWMDGGLTVVGGSAGLPFALNALLAVSRTRGAARSHSWVWHRLFRALHTDAGSWTATGSIGPDGGVGAVVLTPKLRACLRHPGVRSLLVPHQAGTSGRRIARLLDALAMGRRAHAPAESSALRYRLGYASDVRPLRSVPCRHLAQAVLAIGGLRSGWQLSVNALAVLSSVVMAIALPDLRAILSPPRAPLAGAPSSPSPYQLWVVLDTPDPDRFAVVFESDFWVNRRAHLTPSGRAGVPPRAELRLTRRTRQTTRDVDAGVVWVERRPRFLTREFAAGERVGRYSLSYIVRRP